MDQPELKPIPGFVGYEITADGAVWSVPRDGRRGLWLKLDPHPQGYFRASLMRDGRLCRFLVHRLVASAWIGPPPFDGAKVLHKDDVNTNNHYTNLYYGTQAQNMRDAVNNGRIASGPGSHLPPKPSIGEKNGNSKLTEGQVREIKIRLAAGETMTSIALDYPVGPGVINQIKQGRTWRDVEI